MGFSPLNLFDRLYDFLERLGGPTGGRISSTYEERMQARQAEKDILDEIVRYQHSGREDRSELRRLIAAYQDASRVYSEMQAGFCTDKKEHPQHYAVS